MSREPPSLGMFAGTDRSLAAPMAIATLALSTSENAQTGLSQFLHMKMCKSRRNLKYEIVHCARTFQFSFNQFVIGEAIPAQTPQFTVSLTTKGSFLSINPQNDGMRNEALSLARFASSGSTFLSAPLAVEPFEPFLHQKMCRYASTA